MTPIEFKTPETGLGDETTFHLDFGTVRPRVQIPGPRPISEFSPHQLVGQMSKTHCGRDLIPRFETLWDWTRYSRSVKLAAMDGDSGREPRFIIDDDSRDHNPAGGHQVGSGRGH